MLVDDLTLLVVERVVIERAVPGTVHLGSLVKKPVHVIAAPLNPPTQPCRARHRAMQIHTERWSLMHTHTHTHNTTQHTHTHTHTGWHIQV